MHKRGNSQSNLVDPKLKFDGEKHSESHQIAHENIELIIDDICLKQWRMEIIEKKLKPELINEYKSYVPVLYRP